MGAFYGNAIADWLGVFVFVVRQMLLKDPASREPQPHFHVRLGRFLVKHSLTIMLTLTGAAWVVAYARSEVGLQSGPGHQALSQIGHKCWSRPDNEICARERLERRQLTTHWFELIQ